MKKTLLCAALSLTHAAGLFSGAEASEGDAHLAHFRFASGDSLADLRVHYRAFGKP
jgi:hypothetical protein